MQPPPGSSCWPIPRPPARDQVLAGPLEQVTPETITDPLIIRKHLAEIRQRGFVALPGIGVTDWLGIAVPVFGPDNKISRPR